MTNTKDLLEFLQQSELMYKLEEKPEEKTVIVSEEMKSHPLYNKKIVMSKVRDKEIIDFLTKYNGNVVDSIKKDVFALIVKSKIEKSNKMIKAEELKIQILTPDEFKDAYMK